MRAGRPVILLCLAVLMTVSTALFVVDETDQVVVTRFGEYRRTARNPGLHFKWPFIDVVLRFDKRILTSDATPAKYLTVDKKRIVIDHLTRWRIVDPLVFYKSVRNETGARARIDDIVFSELRRELASHPFANIISVEREPITNTVAQRAAEKTGQFGIEIIDVSIKRADLPEEVQASVFARMKAEREREAKRYRSEGEEEVAKIRAKTDKERTIILAEAYEPEAEFYRFTRRLQAYKKIMSEKNMVVLSTGSDLFRFLDTASRERGRD